MTDQPHDATVLRSESSLSGGRGQGGDSASAPRVLKQRFVLDEKLGSGGMGTVFRAKDLRKVEAQDRNPYVAIKVLNNDFREHPEAFIALQREAAKSQALSHRNIVSIYDFDKDGDVPFIIMELLEGEELATLLRRYPTGLPDDMAWSIIRCVCDALEHAHDAGLVHADFKPGNVFVAADHSAKILDFGIARAVQINQAAQGDETVFDPTRLAALTPPYASREMLEGADAEIRDDLYALGVVIYLILTGQHPYQRTPADEGARQGLRPERVRRLSRRQWRGLERCLAFDRADRPESIAELRRALLQSSPWRSRSVVVGVAAVLATLAVSAYKEGAAVQEARVEARQTTLLDAQVARVTTLLEAPEIDADWEDEVAEEVATLRALEGFDAGNSDVLPELRARYLEEIVTAGDPDRAVALYRRAQAYGTLPRARAHLEAVLRGDLERLLDAPALTESWMNALQRALGRYRAAFPASPELAALRLQVVWVLDAAVGKLAPDELPAARRALALLEAYSFDLEPVVSLERRLAETERTLRAREAAQRRRAALADFRGELEEALSGACLRFDPEPAAQVLDRWTSRYPDFESEGRSRISQRLQRCLSRLEAVDQARARRLRERASTLFGTLPGLEAGQAAGAPRPEAAARCVPEPLHAVTLLREVT
ncbi:MAG: protein kinase domain-containing protein [Pseudomonadota bacterium]